MVKPVKKRLPPKPFVGAPPEDWDRRVAGEEGPYGKRNDGTLKGPGFQSIALPGGGEMTEFTVQDDQGREIPTITSWSTPEELKYLGENYRRPDRNPGMWRRIVDNAMRHAESRRSQGLSVFQELDPNWKGIVQ